MSIVFGMRQRVLELTLKIKLLKFKLEVEDLLLNLSTGVGVEDQKLRNNAQLRRENV